eukprot:TRINITY_DN2374_c0_g1_i2.p1 TRINITY_DN2374_c0_g1~~TRINITY_DN2374_c0_g1_i2.p1  ORF type:complete len:481 (-),score=214.23 TRINITY_DN2374_c0_g1_i2:235-1677(-)
MSFAESFLDGFDLLNKRVEGGLKSCSEFATFYKNFAKNEREYAKGLAKLASTEKKEFQKASSSSKEVGSTFSSWEGIFSELEKKADFHNQLATKIENELSLAISNFIKEKTKTKKKLDMDSDKLRKDLKAQHENLSKSRTKYVSAVKESEAQEKLCNDPNQKPSNIPKLETKRRQLVEKAEQADKDYTQTLATTNQKQSEYYQTTMPALLREYQDFEEERVKFMKDQTNTWYVWSAEESPVTAAIFQNVGSHVDAINVDTDISAYCSEFATGVTQPPDIEYQPHEGEGVGTPRGTQRATPQKKPATSGPTRFGTQKVWGLQPGDEHLSEDEKYAKLSAQNDEIEKTIATETKKKDGLENLVRFYASDPVSKKKAEEEVTEMDHIISKLREEQQKIHSQMGGSSSSNGNYNNNSNDSYAQSDSSGGIRMRGLYDYTATADTELSFSEGDILLITNQDDDSWWYAELNGNAGFVPNNYVEPI